MNFSATAASDQTILGRAFRLLLRLIPTNTVVPILRGPLRGRKWIAGSLNHSCWLGGYEHVFQRAFVAAVRRGYAVYDLGANVGFYSLLASSLVGPEGRVISFEPVPRNLFYLRRHLELNKVTNCVVWDAAVGRSDGTGKFDLGYDHYAGHLTNAGDVPGDRPDMTRALDKNVLDVRIVSLDSLIVSGQLPPPDLIKCDIEGAEYDALLGAYATLTKHHPVIFLAVHGAELHQRCCELLADLHYKVALVEDTGRDRHLLATPAGLEEKSVLSTCAAPSEVSHARAASVSRTSRGPRDIGSAQLRP